MSKENRKSFSDTQNREDMLRHYEEKLELPVRILGIVWLLLVLYELIIGIHPVVTLLIYIIWAVFIADFLTRVILSTNRAHFLKKNLIIMFSLMIPALRFLYFLRVMRALSFLRGMRLINLVGTANRSMGSLNTFLGSHHTGYVIILSVIVTLLGSAGMFAFERRSAGSADITTYWDALYFTALVMVTVSPQTYPKTPEGRFLSVLLALYAFAVFGYITAVLASFFIGRDRTKSGH